MASVVLGALRYVLGLDSSAFDQGLDQAERDLAARSASFQRAGAGIAKAGLVMSAAITAPLIGFAAAGIKEAQETEAAMAQVNASLASTGGTAGRTAAQLEAAADAFEMRSLYEGDEILGQVSSRLLAFGNVTGATFDRAQQAIIDYATKTGKPLSAATLAIGKALNDPAKGMAGLAKAGVQLDASQQATITKMLAVNDVAGAQAIILGAIEKGYKGSAQAAQDADPGNAATDAWKKMAETIGKALLPVLPPLVATLASVANTFASLSPETRTWIVIVGGAAAALGPVITVVGGLVAVLGTAIPAMVTFTAGLSGVAAAEGVAATGAHAFGLALRGAVIALVPMLAPLAAVAGAVTLAYVAWQNWDKIKPIIDAALGWISGLYTGVKTWLQDKLGAVLDWVRGKLKAVADTFKWLADVVVFNSYVPDMVDAIGQHMARLDGNMVKPAVAMTEKTAAAFEALRGRVSGILAELFPEQAAFNAFQAKLATLKEGLDKGALSADHYAASVSALHRAFSDATFGKETVEIVGQEALDRDPSETIGNVGTEQDRPATGLLGTLQRMQETMTAIGEIGRSSFTDIADSILASAIPALEAMQSATATLGEKLGALGSLASTVFGAIFGKKVGGVIGAFAQIGANFAKAYAGGGTGDVPAFASGGSFKVGGQAGIDKNLIQFRATKGEMVDIRRPGNDNGGQANIHVTPSKFFDVHVERGAARVAAPMARDAAVAGSAGAQIAMARRQSRRLA